MKYHYFSLTKRCLNVGHSRLQNRYVRTCSSATNSNYFEKRAKNQGEIDGKHPTVICKVHTQSNYTKCHHVSSIFLVSVRFMSHISLQTSHILKYTGCQLAESDSRVSAASQQAQFC